MPVTPRTSALLQADQLEFTKLVSTIKNHVKESVGVIQKIRSKFCDEEVEISSGMTFLDLKNHLLLSYLQNLTLLMLKKSSGMSIENDNATVRIVEIRTALERMRPIENKLKYQIEKLLMAASGERESDGTDPLSFRPNPDQMSTINGNKGSDVDEDGDEDEKDGGFEEDDRKQSNSDAKKRNVYVPPRLAAVPYNFDETPKDRNQKKAERGKKRALNSEIMNELRHQYGDAPVEEHDRDIYRMKADKHTKDREAYEERNMIRLNVSKKDKANAKKVATMSSLSYLADFRDFRGMAEEDSTRDGIPLAGAKKRKKTQQKKGKKGKKFRKHH